MGFLLKALGVGLVVAGVKKIKDHVEEENRRKKSNAILMMESRKKSSMKW